MGKALYRKYRSKNLAEIVGQEHITTALSNALKSGNISHAYLFTGPRGVGKTSVARILAHEVNNLAYDEEANHLDIIEIDAASNRRIDEIRELRERVHTAPAAAKYKVYIIDEVHMLTKEAFNALLKTLEEPPAHVIFILATTEAHKLPETIISRTQRYNFKPIERDKAVTHLRDIADKEHIRISDEALGLIAEHGGGSFRDSISLLDQASSMDGKEVGLEGIQELLGIAPDEVISNLLKVLEEGTPAQLIEKLHSMREHGYNPARTAKQLSVLMRSRLLANALTFDASEIANILQQLLQVSASHDPETSFEIALLSIMLHHRRDSLSQTIKSSPKQESAVPAVKRTIIDKPTTKNKEVGEPEVKEEVPEEEISADTAPIPSEPVSEISDEVWQQALERIKKTHNTLYGVARMARATVTDDEITLCFKFAFHQKRINEAKNKQVFIDTLQAITGKPVKISCTVDKNIDSKPKPTVSKLKAADSKAIDNISNIFGSAEVIE